MTHYACSSLIHKGTKVNFNQLDRHQSIRPSKWLTFPSLFPHLFPAIVIKVLYFEMAVRQTNCPTFFLLPLILLQLIMKIKSFPIDITSQENAGLGNDYFRESMGAVQYLYANIFISKLMSIDVVFTQICQYWLQ